MGWKLTKDGLHLKDFFVQMWPHLRRLLLLEQGVKNTGHAFTNIFVEASRLSPYHSGHIWMVQTILTMGVAIYVLTQR